MNRFEIRDELKKIVEKASASFEDDDAWYLAMHELRAVAWLGKELIHQKRMDEYEAKRIPLATKPQKRETLPVSTLEDMLL